MAVKIVWSPPAYDDLEGIAEYIARDSHEYACRVVERILAGIERVGEYPGSGPVLPEMPAREEYRQIIVQSWRVIYRRHPDAVQIVAIIHGARLLDAVVDRLT